MTKECRVASLKALQVLQVRVSCHWINKLGLSEHGILQNPMVEDHLPLKPLKQRHVQFQVEVSWNRRGIQFADNSALGRPTLFRFSNVEGSKIGYCWAPIFHRLRMFVWRLQMRDCIFGYDHNMQNPMNWFGILACTCRLNNSAWKHAVACWSKSLVCFCKTGF